MPPNRKKHGPALKAMRLALGYRTQTAFCEAIGVPKNVWNPFEKGKRDMTLDVARKVKQRFGIPLDFVLDGDTARLPGELYAKVVKAAA